MAWVLMYTDQRPTSSPAMSRRELSVGRDFHCVPDVGTALADGRSDGFDFVVVPLVHPRFRRTFGKDGVVRDGPFTRSDMLLSSAEWSRLVVGKVSPWIDLDTTVTCERRDSEEALAQELGWASHLGLPAVEIALKSLDCANLASHLSPYVSENSNLQFWVRVPLASAKAVLDPDLDLNARENDTWEWWNALRSLCPATNKLSVALELTADLPEPSKIARWTGEPVRAVIVPVCVFLCNAKGYPVLSKAHQTLVRSLMKFVLKGNAQHGDHGFDAYHKYLRHLQSTLPEPGPLEEFAEGYEDYLQSPLQPLMDNLESNTYEVFEKDPIKYQQYQEAVRRALVDRVSEVDKDNTVTCLMVVGAGRGPLVACALQAAQDAGRKVRVYAIEKNPNAVVTLRTRNLEQWESKVTVVSTDMRHWEAPEQADIMVSELLGSFGDNELSPECLDGAQKFLKDDGISIPANYTSFLCPMSSAKLHTELTNANDKKGFETSVGTDVNGFYVVMLHNIYLMSEIKPCFVFEHPNPDVFTPTGADNSRYGRLEFHVKEAALLHGFAGYFESELYKDVMISINPETHSPGMFSWFPIYFPIKTPMYVPANSKVEVHFWRKVSRTKVWYEWAVTGPGISGIHNPRGQGSFIGL